jgi:hypothetical protein
MSASPLKLVEVPEAELRRLLENNGETLEGFLRRSTPKIEAGKNYQKRAKSAYWSILWLGTSTLFSLICFLSSHSIEDFLSTLLLGGMTYVETRVRTWFLEGDARAAVYGYWNQTTFAVLFLIYGGYHVLHTEVPNELNEYLGGQYDALYSQISKMGYAVIGLVGGTCQYLLALHYRRAGKLLMISVSNQPPPLP